SLFAVLSAQQFLMSSTSPTRAKKFRSIAATIAAAFSVLAVGSLIAMSVAQLFFGFPSPRGSVFTEQQLIAREAASTVRGFVEDKFRLLASTARIGNLATATSDDRRLLLDKLLGEEFAFQQVLLLDTDGGEIAKSTRQSS